jgi:glc operon protein GlcG
MGLVVVSFPASSAVLRAMHGLSDAQYGALFLPQTALAIAGSLAAGALARRLGLRRLLRAALAAGVIAELLLAATTLLAPAVAYAAALCAIGFAGLAFGLASAPLNGFPAALYPARRESALVVVHSLVGAGFAFGPLGVSTFVTQGLWVGFPLLLAAVGTLLFLAPLPAEPAAAQAPAAGKLTGGSPLSTPTFWALAATAVVYALCEGTFASWVVVFLEEERGVSASGAALALSLFWAALVGGRLATSALVTRVPSRLVWGALPVLMALAFALLPRASSALSGAALFALAGFACSAFFPLTVGHAAGRFERHVALVSSLLTAALMLGVGAGSFLLGALRRAVPLDSLYRGSAVWPALLLLLVFTLTRRSKMKSLSAAVLALSLLLPAAARAQVVEKRTLTLEGARRVIAAAVADARARKTTGVFAVVDDGGNLIAVERIDGTFAAGAAIAAGKARTAALFKRPTAVFEELITRGRTPMVALDDFTPLIGGVPLLVDGQIVGAIGVSGAASAKQDEELALAGAAALADAAPTGAAAPVAPVLYFAGADVAAAFARGAPLIETGDYKIHASHRDGPGMAEIHRDDTDLIYVVAGSATLVTGGSVSGGKLIADGETRGAAIRGGETRKLARGDVIVVPRGVPHWFKEVNGAFDYYVVKVH